MGDDKNMDQATNSHNNIWDFWQTDGVDSFSGNSGRIKFLVRQLRPGSRVLNIGVGNALLERLAIQNNVDIYCLDPSEPAIASIHEHLNLGDKAKAGYGENIPFESNFFDAVVMSEVLEHLDDASLFATLAEVQRVLRENGGEFIGTTPARENLLDNLVVCPCCGEKFHRWGHQQSFNVLKMRETLAKYFKLKVVDEYFFIEWDGVSIKNKLLGLIKKFLSWRGLGTYGICRNIYFKVVKN
jgi:SAM-dependent methyltransferase